jgi:hypothetical protein
MAVLPSRFAAASKLSEMNYIFSVRENLSAVTTTTGGKI